MGDQERGLVIHEQVPYGSYVDGFKCGARYAKHVAAQMRNAAPADLDAHEQKALEIAIEYADGVGEEVTERTFVANVRPSFESFQGSWGGMHDALVAKMRVPASLSGDESERAARVYATVFPDGAGIMRLDARAAWVEGERRLKVVDDRGLAAELDALIGAGYLRASRQATSELREAVGAGATARVLPRRGAVRTSLLRFSRAMSKYARLLAAKVDEDDAASVQRFLRAMAPIDAYRASRAGRTIDEEDEPAGPEPVEPEPGSDPVT